MMPLKTINQDLLRNTTGTPSQKLFDVVSLPCQTFLLIKICFFQINGKESKLFHSSINSIVDFEILISTDLWLNSDDDDDKNFKISC